MCDVASIIIGTISAVVGVASATASGVAAAQQAEQQERANRIAFLQADEAQKLEILSLNQEQAQERHIASRSLRETEIAAAEAESTANVAAAEAGLSGHSVNAAVQKIKLQKADQVGAINTQLTFSADAARLGGAGAQARARNRVANLPPVPGAGLAIGGAALQGVSSGIGSVNLGLGTHELIRGTSLDSGRSANG